MRTLTELDENKIVPMIEMKAVISSNVTEGDENPKDVSTSKALKINGEDGKYYNLVLRGYSDSEGLTGEFPKRPNWKVKVSLGNAENVTKGDAIYINSRLSFEGDDNKPLLTSDIDAGDWIFPIEVTDNNPVNASSTDYILAFLKVTITKQDKEKQKELVTNVITELENEKVPTLDVSINLTGVIPQDEFISKTLKIKGEEGKYYSLELKGYNDSTGLTGEFPEKPKWKVKVSIGNTDNVTKGTPVYVNAQVFFDREHPDQLSLADIKAGDWLFPIQVKDNKTDKEYLFAYIKVSIVDNLTKQ